MRFLEKFAVVILILMMLSGYAIAAWQKLAYKKNDSLITERDSLQKETIRLSKELLFAHDDIFRIDSLMSVLQTKQNEILMNDFVAKTTTKIIYDTVTVEAEKSVSVSAKTVPKQTETANPQDNRTFVQKKAKALEDILITNFF